MKKVDERWTLYFSDRSNETLYRLPKQFAERKRRSSLALHPVWLIGMTVCRLFTLQPKLFAETIRTTFGGTMYLPFR